jgi:hypothetical protein
MVGLVWDRISHLSALASHPGHARGAVGPDGGGHHISERGDGFEPTQKGQEAVHRFCVIASDLLLWASCFLSLGPAYLLEDRGRRVTVQ